jgi:hypothetical protein
MTIFDLLFIAVFLASCVLLLIAAVQALRGRLHNAGRTLAYLASGLAVYLFALCIVSLTAHQKVVAIHEPQCSDDWCVAVSRTARSGQLLEIEFTVQSRALRVRQREFDVDPYLIDNTGREYHAKESAGPPFDKEIGPGEAFTTIRRYQAGPGAFNLILRPRHLSPGTFVIGDEASLLHPRTIVKIE